MRMPRAVVGATGRGGGGGGDVDVADGDLGGFAVRAAGEVVLEGEAC